MAPFLYLKIFLNPIFKINHNLKKLALKTWILEIVNKLSEIEFDSNNGVFLFNSQNLVAAKLQGTFSNLLYNLKL